MMANFSTIETSENNFRLTASQPRSVSTEYLTNRVNTTYYLFAAARYSGVQFWAFDKDSSQQFKNGNSVVGYLINQDGNDIGLFTVTLPPGNWAVGALYNQSLANTSGVDGFYELSAVSLPGQSLINNVPMFVSGGANSWKWQGFTVTGTPSLYIETEATGGEFVIMSDTQFSAFQSVNPNGYTGAQFTYTLALASGVNIGTELEGQLAIGAGHWGVLWINNTGDWAGGAANVLGFGSSATLSPTSGSIGGPGGSGGGTGGGGTGAVASKRLDFNGDGSSDVLWRHSGGAVGMWSAGSERAYVGLGGAGLDWRIAGVGDFNGDGKADVLWLNNNGAVGMWSAGSAGSFVALGGGSPDWRMAGVGDFYGDGKADILWRNVNGAVGMWSAGSATTFVSIGGAGLDWQIAGVGDFNGDGKSDILWRNNNGSVGMWGSANSFDLLGGAGSDWTIAGVGDFNGDGKSDVLWRHNDGSVGMWSAGSAGAFVALGGAGSDWKISGVGDFNGDGKSDILWRHDSGSVGMWSAGSASAFVPLGKAGSDWTIAIV